MDYGDFMNRRLHGWGSAKLHVQIRYKAVEKGIPVETVNPHNTSKGCHACGKVGYNPRQATFKYTNDACWMVEYQADVNGAINIADRYLSGESHSKEHTDGDDSAKDEGRLTAPQDTQADATTQETLGTYGS
jgi:transposase